MAKYKNIKSAIHNWAHSFFSIENFNEDGYFVQELYKAAKSVDTELLTLNVLTGELFPRAARTEQVISFIKSCSSQFSKQLHKQSVEIEMLSSVELTVKYEFNQPFVDVKGIFFQDMNKAPAAVRYEVKVVAIDNRGIKHEAGIKEWWR